ncbi:MAG: hypothetical protein K8U57_31310 [Planctomycetes bacterium]|nr:hypothetical protein [Planctomycetota bacterium]
MRNTPPNATTHRNLRCVVILWSLEAHHTLLGRTMVGAADRDDDVERGAVLLGKRLDVKEGERVVVRGVLRVIQHKGGVVSGVIAPAWLEVRVTEVK